MSRGRSGRTKKSIRLLEQARRHRQREAEEEHAAQALEKKLREEKTLIKELLRENPNSKRAAHWVEELAKIDEALKNIASRGKQE